MAADKGPDAKERSDGQPYGPRLSLRARNILLVALGSCLCITVTLLFYLQQTAAQYAHLRSNASDIFLVFALALVSLILLMLLSVGVLLAQSRQSALAQEKSLPLTPYFNQTPSKAETTNQGKSRFLANMSHVLRTPFNGVFGMLSLLGTTPLNAMQADYLKIANASANHLLSVLNDILDLSALEEGKISLTFAPVELRQVISDISDAMRPQAEQRKLDFNAEVHPDVPQWLLMDGKRLKQILFNLSNNALQFTSNGGIQIKVKLGMAPSLADKDFVLLEISVEDSGIGISSEAMENLFQRFNQIHNSINKDYGGTGLGLEISQSLAHLMGGADRGRECAGPRFLFYFAHASAVDTSALAQQPSQGISTGSTDQTGALVSHTGGGGQRGQPQVCRYPAQAHGLPDVFRGKRKYRH